MDCENTFVWRELRQWGIVLEAVIPSEERQDLVRAIEQYPERFKYTDDVACFSDIYSQFSDYSHVEKRLPTHMRSAFVSVRMFHCCRPVSVQSYYDHGLRVLDSREANGLFRTIFLDNPRFPEITASHVEAAIVGMTESYKRHGYVYFGLDDRFLIQHCGQYLMYGSEYLLALAASVECQVERSARSELRRIGIPTIFVVDVPVQHFSDSDLMELGASALHAWAYGVAHQTDVVRKIDYGIGIEHCLGPGFIRDHYTPAAIPDPFEQNLPYRYRDAG